MENNTFYQENFFEMQKEKKEQRRVANFAALSLLILFVFMFGWSFIYIRVMGNLGIPYKNIVKILENPIANDIIQIIVSVLMLIIPSLVLCRLLHLKVRDIVPFGLPKTKNNFVFFVAAMGFCMFASQASNIGGAIIESFGVEFPTMDRTLPEGVFGIALVILSTSVFPALLEEFMMRGVVLGVFKKFGQGFAIIVSSILFAVMHASLTQFAFAFLVGIILGFITVKSGSVWPAVIIHAANNFVSVVFSYLGLYLETKTLNLVFYIFICLLFAASVFCTVLVSRDKEFLKFEKADTKSGEKQKLIWFLTSPAVIVTILVAVLISAFLR